MDIQNTGIIIIRTFYTMVDSGAYLVLQGVLKMIKATQ